MSSNSNRGKFSEKMKRIALFRRRCNKKNIDSTQIEDPKKIYTNFLKVVAAIPGIVYDNVTYNSSNKNDKIKTVCDENNHDIDNLDGNNYFLNKSNVRTIKDRLADRKKVNDISIDEIKNNYKLRSNYQKRDVKDKFTDDDDKIKELEKSILNLMKKDLIKMVNEFEILQSELYILSEVNGESKVLKDCQRELDYVKNLLCKIDKLKTKYDFLKDNYDFEYLLEIDNNDLVDKIIELRDSFGENELKVVAHDYKLLDVYRKLYLTVDNLQDEMAQFEEKKQEELLKLKERDIDFEKLKAEVYNVKNINNNYDIFVQNQNELLKNIQINVEKIDSYQKVEYHLKGFGQLFRNCFKYFGLFMLSPLKGIIPSIATETLITGNIIKNLYSNLEWQETKKMVYEAIDYSSMINNAIINLDSTSMIVDNTLDDIVHLKMKYNEKFKKYQGDFTEYNEIIQKINDMENKILGNKIKIEMMKKRALEQQKINDKKIKLVKKLNSMENHK